MLNTAIFSILSRLGLKESNSISKRTLSTNRDTSTLDTESEVHAFTTVSPVNIPNHQPVFKSLVLHEHLLTRDFQGDQHFFGRDGSVAAYSTMPGSVFASEARDPVTQLVPHEDAPAFSDIATTATAAATSPLMTFSPATPRPTVSLHQKKSTKDRTRGEDKVEPTTGSLSTEITPENRGSVNENKQVAPSPLQRGQPQSLSAYPAEATLAPSSMRMDKGEARETVVKNKTSPGHPLLNPTSTSREQGSAMMSTIITTNTPTNTSFTIMQTAGRHVHVFLNFQSCLCDVNMQHSKYSFHSRNIKVETGQKFNTSIPEEREINSTTVHFTCCAPLSITPTGIIELPMCQKQCDFP